MITTVAVAAVALSFSARPPTAALPAVRVQRAHAVAVEPGAAWDAWSLQDVGVFDGAIALAAGVGLYLLSARDPEEEEELSSLDADEATEEATIDAAARIGQVPASDPNELHPLAPLRSLWPGRRRSGDPPRMRADPAERVRPIAQRPWYIGLVSKLVIDGTIKDCGLTEEGSAFNRSVYAASVKRVPPVAGGKVIRKDLEVPCAVDPGQNLDDVGTNAARLYTPREKQDAHTSAPLIIYMHGGGWVLGACQTQPYDALCATLTNELSCCVLSVDYRTAPENPWPAGVEDVYNVLLWLAQNPEIVPAADLHRVVLMGESAGANLAACASLLWRDRRPEGITVAHQVLLSPCVPTRPLRPTRLDPARANGALLPAWLMLWFEERYAGERGVDALSREPYANPLAAESLAKLPPLTGVVGGAEILRDEGVEYFEAVRDAGGEAEWREFDKGYHAFVIFPFGDSRHAWKYVYERLRASLGEW